MSSICTAAHASGMDRAISGTPGGLGSTAPPPHRVAPTICSLLGRRSPAKPCSRSRKNRDLEDSETECGAMTGKTVHDPTFFEFMGRFTGNRAGTGGLVAIKGSNWRMSVVLAHQPYFLDQPENVQVFWGHALWPGRRGDCTDKLMRACSGKEVLEDLLFHLPVGDAHDRILEAANGIPCQMPLITSLFMPRSAGDRPAVNSSGGSQFRVSGAILRAGGRHGLFGRVFPTIGRASRGCSICLARSRPYRAPGVVLWASRALSWARCRGLLHTTRYVRADIQRFAGEVGIFRKTP